MHTIRRRRAAAAAYVARMTNSNKEAAIVHADADSSYASRHYMTYLFRL